MENTTSLADKFVDVNKRLIQAFSIDTSNDNVNIEWDQFLSLKCFMELFTLSENELQTIWIKALDPRGLLMVPLTDFSNFIERLARGSMSDSPTPVSRVFSQQMYEMLEREGCLTDLHQDQVDVEKLRRKIVDERSIDIEIFN